MVIRARKSPQKAQQPQHLPLFHAACACGAVRYKVRVDPKSATPCICARCRGQGLKIARVEAENFAMLTGEDNLTEQLNDARTPHHFFCRTCGEAVFGRVELPDGGALYSVNVACLPRGSLAAIGLIERRLSE